MTYNKKGKAYSLLDPHQRKEFLQAINDRIRSYIGGWHFGIMIKEPSLLDQENSYAWEFIFPQSLQMSPMSKKGLKMIIYLGKYETSLEGKDEFSQLDIFIDTRYTQKTVNVVKLFDDFFTPRFIGIKAEYLFFREVSAVIREKKAIGEPDLRLESVFHCTENEDRHSGVDFELGYSFTRGVRTRKTLYVDVKNSLEALKAKECFKLIKNKNKSKQPAYIFHVYTKANLRYIYNVLRPALRSMVSHAIK